MYYVKGCIIDSGSELMLIQSEVAAKSAPLDLTLEKNSMCNVGAHMQERKDREEAYRPEDRFR